MEIPAYRLGLLAAQLVTLRAVLADLMGFLVLVARQAAGAGQSEFIEPGLGMAPRSTAPQMRVQVVRIRGGFDMTRLAAALLLVVVVVTVRTRQIGPEGRSLPVACRAVAGLV